MFGFDDIFDFDHDGHLDAVERDAGRCGTLEFIKKETLCKEFIREDNISNVNSWGWRNSLSYYVFCKVDKTE